MGFVDAPELLLLVHILIAGLIVIGVLGLVARGALGLSGLLNHSAWVEGAEFSSILIDLEGFILKHLVETVIAKHASLGIDFFSVLLLLEKLVDQLLVDLDLLGASDSACTLLLNLILDTLRSLFFPDIRVGNQPSLLVQLGGHKVTVHVRSEQVGLSNKVRQAQLLQFGKCQELVVVVCFGANLLGHLFDHVVQECAPLGRGTELRNEECVLLLAFVGCHDHTSVFTPSNVVDVHNRFHGRPWVSCLLIPQFNDALISR
ncbi:hypothetical protein HG531_005428 [Fusarium graminearum]|nr:hypothetical protein HG531_005428 [Fusarium graminearum]